MKEVIRFRDIFNETVGYAMSILEKFSDTFRRDFGEGGIHRNNLPYNIRNMGIDLRIETYVHGKELVWSYVFDAKGDFNEVVAIITGSMDDPSLSSIIQGGEGFPADGDTTHPNHKDSIVNYTGVYPIKPPFNDYHGTFHIPAVFGMDEFPPEEDIRGVQQSD